MRILGIPLGWILHFCYSLVQNYGLALVMFTVLARLILLPLSIKQQKGMVKMAMFRPKMEEIQKKYAKNPQKMNEELTNLYAREGYNPMSGCLPTLIQFPILFGLIDVIYNPLTHLLRMDAATISNAVSIAQSVLGEGGMSRYSREMSVISAVAQNPAAFSSIGGDFVSQIQNFDFTFFGLDLGTTPSFALNLFLLIPILSGLTSFLMSWLSMKNNAMPNEGSTAAMNRSMMIMMPLMSVWISFQVPAGVGIYWVLSNALALIQMYVLGKLYNPREMAAKAKAELEAQREAERQEKIEARKAAKEKQAEKNRKAAEAAKAGKKRNAPVEVEEETLIDLVENDEVDEKALSQKEINRMKLAAARRRDAERYGEEYVEVSDEDLE